MPAIKLFQFVREDIKVDIEARFEEEDLIIDGYDIGKTVEGYWGDSDYEYNTKVFSEGVDRLYEHFGIQSKDKEELLAAIFSRFNSNQCYSEFQKLLDDLKIKYEAWSWT